MNNYPIKSKLSMWFEDNWHIPLMIMWSAIIILLMYR